MKKICGVILALVILVCASLLCVKPYEKTIVYPEKYAGIIEQYSGEYGIDKNLMFALVCTESGFTVLISLAFCLTISAITAQPRRPTTRAGRRFTPGWRTGSIPPTEKRSM